MLQCHLSGTPDTQTRVHNRPTNAR